MPLKGATTSLQEPARAVRLALAMAGGLMLSGCAGLGESAQTTLASGNDMPSATGTNAQGPRTELEKATDYWGQQYSKNPRDLTSALNYARNLKAAGQKGQALAVLQQASIFHGNDRKLASEYGRLALEVDQVGLAKQLLQIADNPSDPDWRVISARGTVLAKEGNYNEAIPFFERALTLSNEQPSVLNNLALAYTMSGEAQKAEALLRRAASAGSAGSATASNSKVRQNLSLVLGLQGKYDEARQIAAREMPAETASANAEYLRHLVKLEPVPAPIPASPAPAATVQTAKASAPAAASTPETSAQLKPTDTAQAAGGWSTTTTVTAAAKTSASASSPGFKPATR